MKDFVLHVLIGILVLLLAGPNRALAHGGAGAEQIANEDLGPVRIWVWSDPEPPQVGEYHVSIALTESLPDDPNGFAGKPVLDWPITVELTHLASGTVLTQPATHENATNKVFYEASFAPEEAGEWQVRVIVQGPDGPVETQYTDVIEPSSFPWTTVAGGAAAVLLLAGAVLLYLKGQPRAEAAPVAQRD
ncbi:MAG: hypothetical protein D6790_01070 [Caldilineae bacterium]|nr:MAG: hypothetical protein D6790_01070 [Caldilineae bacterium]